MNVGDLLRGLSYGELRHLFVGMSGAGTIADGEKDRLVFLADQALKQIYSRVAHNLHYVTLQTSATRKVYPIRPIHRVSDQSLTNTADRFILDSASDPFTGQLLKIRSVRVMYDPTEPDADPTNLLLNDTASGHVRTVSYDTLRIESPIEGALFELELQMAHVPLTLPADLTQTIEIIPLLEEALFAKVAHSVFAGMGGEESLVKAQNLNNRYEALLANVVMEDLAQQSSSHEDSRLMINGWI